MRKQLPTLKELAERDARRLASWGQARRQGSVPVRISDPGICCDAPVGVS